jgi:hypothetical protein
MKCRTLYFSIKSKWQSLTFSPRNATSVHRHLMSVVTSIAEWIFFSRTKTDAFDGK